MNSEKGMAIIIAVMMTLLFALIGGAVLFYSRSNTELGYRQVRKVKAYYAAEAGLQFGSFQANNGWLDGSYPYSISVGGEPIDMQFSIQTNADDTKTVTVTVPDIDDIRLLSTES